MCVFKISDVDVMIQEGTTFDHDFYVVVDKQCRTENAYAGHQHISLYKLTNALLFQVSYEIESLLILKFISIFQKTFLECENLKTYLKQINNK